MQDDVERFREASSDHRINRITWLSLLVGVICLAGLGVVAAAQGDRAKAAADRAVGPNAAQAELAAPTPANAKALSQMFRAAAKRVLPAVVVVETSNGPQGSATEDDMVEAGSGIAFSDETDEEGYVEYYSDNDAVNQPALASGVIVHPTGIVLTNQHVVEDAQVVTVHLPDGREFAVRQVSPLPGIDLAVLHLECDERLPAAVLGDSDSLEIGDWVLAAGCPLELEQTVSAGIISAKGRSVREAGQAQLLQTDAAINPGSSGGPLVNLDGEVVGITTAIASEDGGYQGIGFAVPINVAKRHGFGVNQSRQAK